MRNPFASLLIAKIAPSMGVAVELEPEFHFAGELVFPDGRRHLFRNTNFNVNLAGSAEIAKDKGYTSFFLRKHGFRVPDNKAFFSERLNANLAPGRRRGIDDAVAYAKGLGFPVFVKPNNLSQGVLVTKVHDAQGLTDVAPAIFERTDVLLVERLCKGTDVRIVVLGQRVISAYERIPLAVVGDGVSDIEALIAFARDGLEQQGRPNSEIDLEDPRIDALLARQGLSRRSVLPLGAKQALLDNANLSTGGTSRDVTDNMHSSFVRIAVAASEALGLKLCGVDLMCDDISADANSQSWNIIEMNAAPGLDNYAASGAAQAARVESLYREIIAYLGTVGARAG
jgi:D-alanine-D-alanine ligase-like ATP-grasp enzyme